jgi:hypothetical protein
VLRDIAALPYNAASTLTLHFSPPVWRAWCLEQPQTPMTFKFVAVLSDLNRSRAWNNCSSLFMTP